MAHDNTSQWRKHWTTQRTLFGVRMNPPLQERRHHGHVRTYADTLLVILKFARKKNKWEGLNVITEYADSSQLLFCPFKFCPLQLEVVQWHPQSSSIHSPSFLPSNGISLPPSHPFFLSSTLLRQLVQNSYAQCAC